MIKLLTILLLISCSAFGQQDYIIGGTYVNLPASNIAPVSNAGTDISITLPTNSIILSGSGTDVDGTVISYAWVKLTGGAATITSPTFPSTSVTGLVAGSYTFQLTVTDNFGLTSTDVVAVTVNAAANVNPSANANIDQTITAPTSSVTLSGSGTDTDGTISSYAWIKIFGGSATIVSPSSATTAVNSLVPDLYQFELTVTDNNGGIAKDTVNITVNSAVNVAPTVDAGTDVSITLPTNSTSLTAVGSDVDGTISSYAWIKISGPATGTIGSPGAATTALTNLVQGVYKFEVTVTDDDGAIAKDVVQVTVNPANISPVANAGTDQVITLPTNTTTLTGSGTDVDGTIASYAWTKISGPSGGAITSASSATTGITALIQGTYTYRLTVTDDDGATHTDDIRVFVNPAVVTSPTGAYTFTLADSANVSAGVYKLDSTMVRTLFSNVRYGPGFYTKYWDGKDDQGITLSNPDASYVIKVLSNNVQYHWDGTIGNNSDSMTGEHKYRGYYHCMKAMCISDTSIYYSTGYAEGSSSIGKSNTATPQTKNTLFQNAANGQTGDVRFVATDNNYVYWGVGDAAANSNSFVFATRISDDLEVAFSSGSPYAVTYGKTYNYAISKFNQANSLITGLAVQKTGNYLFVARSGANLLQVLNKTTGLLIQSLTYTAPGSIAIDAADNLWMITGTTVARYPVNVNGTLAAANLTLSGPVEPVAIQVSYDGTKIAVADAAAAIQQLKFFSTTTGSSTSTLGVAGGYTVDATVNNNKFYFNDTRISQNKYQHSFIAYQSDGSYWVSDPANFRVQHYNSSNTFINRIQSLGATYRTWVDKNNITRVFDDYLEFNIDYSQPLTGSTGWTLAKNWGANVLKNGDAAAGQKYNTGMLTPITLSNGRTYMWLSWYNTTTRALVELVAGGTMRFTGVTRTGIGSPIARDGSIHTYAKGFVGGQGVFKRYPLTGFDGSNNPLWSATADHVTTTPVLTINDAEFSPITTETISSRNKLIFYNPSSYLTFITNGNPNNVPYPGYHLEAMDVGGSNWTFKTGQATHVRYMGEYPDAGYFDIGNTVNLFAGANINVVGQLIFTSYHGEFWKAMQTNKYNVHSDNGLAIGQFGVTRPEIGGLGVHAAAGMAGNAVTPCFVYSITTDTIYGYHSDESDHSALHRWSVTGLNTIAQHDTTIAFPINYVAPAVNYVDLLAGLPFDDTLTNNTAGWTRNTVENYANQYSSYYSAKTSVLTYNKLASPDLRIKFIDAAAKRDSVTRSLGSNTVTNDWTISGVIAFPSNVPNGTPSLGINSQMFMDVQDNTGKILTRFYVTRLAGVPINAKIVGNTVTIATGLESSIKSVMNDKLPFSIQVLAGVVTITYGSYTPVVTTIFDPAGDWTKPTTLQFKNISVAGTAYTNIIVPIEFKFYKDIL